MKSFDDSLKYLLHQRPIDFIRFGLADATVELVEPTESALPYRGRDIDGGYLVRRDGDPVIAHVEFHRRHQSLEDLRIDVAEAQIRLFRRERTPILSQVWDLYGNHGEPLLKEQTLPFGATNLTSASRAVYIRVNMRALTAEDLLTSAPPALWPLVALTHDGARADIVQRTCIAIEARPDLTSGQRADHLAVLWFVSEAEQVAVEALKVYLSKEKLMESVLYREIFAEGKAEGIAEGKAKGIAEGKAEGKAEMLVLGLTHHLGTLDSAVRARIRSVTNLALLDAWFEQLLDVHGAGDARALVKKIMATNGQ